VTGSRMQHGGLASLGDRLRPYLFRADHRGDQEPARNDPSSSNVHHVSGISPGSGLWFVVGLLTCPQ